MSYHEGLLGCLGDSLSGPIMRGVVGLGIGAFMGVLLLLPKSIEHAGVAVYGLTDLTKVQTGL